MKKQLLTFLYRLWPALFLEVLYFSFNDRFQKSDDGIWLFLAGFTPTMVAAFLLAKGPRHIRTAVFGGMAFWVGSSIVWILVLAIRVALTPEGAQDWIAVAGGIFAAIMFSPLAAIASLISGFGARIRAKSVA